MSQYSTMTQTQTANLLAQVLADKAGVTIKPHNNPKGTWRADTENKVIEYPAGELATNPHALALLVHEAGHLRFTSNNYSRKKHIAKITKKYGKNGELLSELMNAIEDARVERAMVNLYKGAEPLFTANNDFAQSTFVDAYYFTEGLSEAWQENLPLQFIVNCSTAVSYSSPELQIIEEVSFMTEPAIVKDIAKLSKAMNKACDTCKTTEELAKFVDKKVIPVFVKYLPDMNKSRDKQKNKDKQKQQAERLSKMLDELSKPMTKKEQEEARQDSKQEIKPNQSPQEAIQEEVEEKKRKQDMQNMQNMKSKRGDKAGKFKIDYKADNFLPYDEFISRVEASLPRMRRTVSILKDISISRYEPNKKSGILDQRRLPKLFTKSERVFKQKLIAQQDPNIEVGILLDISGSMNGKRINEATIACALLARSLERAGKRVAIYSFDNHGYTVKRLNERTDMTAIHKLIGGCTGGTTMTSGLDVLRKEMDANKTHARQNLIILTDGESQEYGYFNGKHMSLMDVLEDTKRAGYDIFGVGIQCEAIKEYVKNSVVVNQAEEIADVLAQLFQRTVGKRTR